MKQIFLMACACIFLASCGGSGGDFEGDVPTNSIPVVSRIDPTDASRGDLITIFGLGFSFEAPQNIVIIGDSMTTASTYSLVDEPTATEIESLTVIVPDDAPEGENSIVVQVHDNTSNADMTITVTP